MRRANDNEKCSFEGIWKKEKISTTTIKHKEMENSVVLVGIIKIRIKQHSYIFNKSTSKQLWGVYNMTNLWRIIKPAVNISLKWFLFTLFASINSRQHYARVNKMHA